MTSTGWKRGAAEARREAVVASAESAVRRGAGLRAVAQTLGMTPDSVRVTLLRSGRQELADRLRRNWLRSVVENAEWMLHGRESLAGAAARMAATGQLGCGDGRALRELLYEAGRNDLVAALTSNEPKTARMAS